MSEHQITVDDTKKEIVVHMPLMDVYAGLRQTARQAFKDQMPNTGQRCDEYADKLELCQQLVASLADPTYVIVIRGD